MNNVRTTYIALLVCLFLLASATLVAQSPRVTLVEEVSNASCVPCARDNPVFEAFLHPRIAAGRVIPVVFHGNWPGPDVMFTANPSMVLARLAYYGTIVYAPTALVNGRLLPPSNQLWWAGAPADTASLAAALDSLSTGLSPISISLSQKRIGDEIVASVTASSSMPLSRTHLRVVAVEGEHYYPKKSAGSNEEEHFLWIARRMLPDHDGVSLELNAGETMTLADTFAIDSRWDADQIYLVAFVQDDTTHEVLQAATNARSVELRAHDRVAVRQQDADGIARWRASAIASEPGRYRVTIDSLLPAGWTIELTSNGTPIADGDSVTIDSDSLPVRVAITPIPGSIGTAIVGVTLTGDRGARSRREFRLYTGMTEMLAIVKGRKENELLDIYRPSLDRTGIEYTAPRAGDDDLFELEDYRLVLLATEGKGLRWEEIARLKRYLEDDGRLMLMGSEIAWSLADARNDNIDTPRDVPFLQNYLHATYTSGTSSTEAVNGVRNDPIGDGLSFLLEFREGLTPDRVMPRANTKTSLFFGASRDSAVVIRHGMGEERVVFATFGLESLADSARRDSLVERSLTWLLGEGLTLGVEEEQVTSTSDLFVAPNPSVGITTLGFTLRARTHVRASIHDAAGRRIREVVDTTLDAGEQRLRIDLSDLPTGAYLIVVDADGRRRGVLVGI